ncbi:hypothetical protein N7533_002629 [Penicillium manginii]|uniref:uncharacterized protein n=1 Tax=Penicillium manginii TaxID=203109 RepID=UPI002546DA99|nr:uncharacterized protein N7533_002629 [Penicillium manginii]KAJ5763948.1 hypothetical protein N7533_002629 [Penicillium manginii]
MAESKKDLEDEIPVHVEQTVGAQQNHDDVFGELSDDGPNFRNVGFVGTIVLMMKSQIGLGVLAIPSAFDTLGMVPGIICLLVMAVITTWSGASAILSLSIGMNAVSNHATCTAVFAAVAAIVGFGFSSIRTLGRITWLAWVGLPCILTAVTIVTIAVGIQERPAAAPTTDGPWVSDWKIVGNPSFAEAIAAVSNLLFAFSGTPGFFSIVSEMRNPERYPAAMASCQAVVTVVYAIIGGVIYYYCGSYVSSPALGSAGGVIKIISYGFALPGLLGTMTIVTHIPAKFIFVHLLRGSKHLSSNTPTHWISWLGCTFGVTVIAWIIASTIPVFKALVSLIGALLGPVMCIQPMGAMWLYDNWEKGKGQKKTNGWIIGTIWSVVLIVLGTFLMVAGTYGSVLSIVSAYTESGGSAAFSCADNSNST